MGDGKTPLDGDVVEDVTNVLQRIQIRDSPDTSFNNLMTALGIEKDYQTMISPLTIIKVKDDNTPLYRTALWHDDVLNKDFLSTTMDYKLKPFLSYSDDPASNQFLVISGIESLQLSNLQGKYTKRIDSSNPPFEIYSDPSRSVNEIKFYGYLAVRGLPTNPPQESTDRAYPWVLTQDALSGRRDALTDDDDSTTDADDSTTPVRVSKPVARRHIVRASSASAPRPVPASSAAPLSSAAAPSPSFSSPAAAAAAALPAVPTTPAPPAVPTTPAPPAPLALLAPPAPLASARVEESLDRPVKVAEEKLVDERQVVGLGAAAFAIAALSFLSAL